MITGHFDLTLKGAGGLGDEGFREAMRQGRLSQLLDGLPTQAEYHTDNLIFDMMVGYQGLRVFQAPVVGRTDLINSDSSAYFASICLLSTDADPAYYGEWDWSNWQSCNIHGVSDSVNTSTAGKRFEEDASEAADIRSDPGGREAIWYRERWLYLTSESNSSNIRSVGIIANPDATNAGSTYHFRVGRVRIKDSGGNPIIINKSSSQVLLVEYKTIFVSV